MKGILIVGGSIDVLSFICHHPASPWAVDINMINKIVFVSLEP